MDNGVTNASTGGIGNCCVHQKHPAHLDDAEDHHGQQESDKAELDQGLAASIGEAQYA